MKKHLGLFIFIFLAMISSVGALLICGKPNEVATTDKTDINTSVSDIEFEPVSLTADSEAPQIEAIPTSNRNTYNFRIVNSDTVNASSCVWYKKLNLEDGAIAQNLTGSSLVYGAEVVNVTISDNVYYVYVVDTSNGNAESNKIPIIPTFIVTFNSSGGNAVASQEVGMYSNATRPSNPIKSGEVFGGWYTEAECSNLWNFNDPKQQIDRDIMLYARWVRMTCSREFANADTETLPQSYVREIKLVFRLDIAYNDNISWYVNGILAQHSSSKTFEYAPETNGTHTITCKVGAVQSNTISWPVAFYIPRDGELKLTFERSSLRSYIVRVEHERLQSIDFSKFIWYVNGEKLATGDYERIITLDTNSTVYVKYSYSGVELSTNQVSLSIKSDLMNIPLILGVGATIILLTITLVIIRKKYIKYRDTKYATFYTWHKW